MIKGFRGINPKIYENCFVADNSSIIGNVTIESEASIWYGAVLRGDVMKIHIGKGSNIQDNCTIHGNEGEGDVNIGEFVTVGHNVIIHGCSIGNSSLIGMGSIILDNAEIGENVIIGAGSLVTSGKKIPSGVLCMGSPAKVIRELTPEEKTSIKESALHYIKLAEDNK